MSRVAQLKMYGTKGVPPCTTCIKSYKKNKENLLEIDGLNLMKQLPQKTTDETI